MSQLGNINAQGFSAPFGIFIEDIKVGDLVFLTRGDGHRSFNRFVGIVWATEHVTIIEEGSHGHSVPAIRVKWRSFGRGKNAHINGEIIARPNNTLCAIPGVK